MNEPTVSQPVIAPTEPKPMPQFKSEWNPATATGSIPAPMSSLSPQAADSASSQQEPSSGGSTASSDLTGDAEGVWSVDIDQAFQEALAIYPPCGRRKIIISDEGKMYGRNELIARYIKLRCGKTRTRKQVSSHIQVLARKKMRDEQAKKKAETTVSVTAPSATTTSTPSPVAPTIPVTTIAQPPRVPMNPFPQLSAMPTMPTMPSVPTVPALPTLPITDAKEFINKAGLLPAAMYPHLWQSPFPVTNLAYNTDLKPFGHDFAALAMVQAPIKSESPDGNRAIASSKLTLNGFNAYVEMTTGERTDIVTIPAHVNEIENLKIKDVVDKYPRLLTELFAKGPQDAFYLAKCWANVQFPPVDPSMLFAVDSKYTASSRFDIQVSTKVCSFANQVVEKVEVYSAEEVNGEYEFRCEKSPMCEYMVQFISELMKLDEDQWKNNVLENFNVLQVITNKQTNETLMVMCFDFEVNKEPQPMCSIFKLTT